MDHTGNTAVDLAASAARPSPHGLPARYRVAPDPRRAGSTEASVYLSERVAVVRRQVAGLPLTLTVPLHMFEGIAVRIEPEGADRLFATVELCHRDPALTLPLASGDVSDVAAEWQAWARRLRLPMLIVEANGARRRVEPVATAAPASAPRRHRAFFSGRRPRFLMRRKPGVTGPQIVLNGREIIARD